MIEVALSSRVVCLEMGQPEDTNWPGRDDGQKERVECAKAATAAVA
jgi:hypothetical protein